MSTDLEHPDFLKDLPVLYVEDDGPTRNQVGPWLQRRVGSLVCAASGSAGLDAFRDRPARIVVTDICMPVLDGLNMAEEIRRLDPAVAIIVTTAFEQTDYMARSIELGVDRYVTKPIRFDQLEAALWHCAHKVVAQEVLRQRAWFEAEALRVRHQESVRILTGGLAHDFNNLLQAILASFSLIRQQATPNSAIGQNVLLGETAATQARTLVRRLASLSVPSETLDHVGTVDTLLRRAVATQLDGTDIRAVFAFGDGGTLIECNQASLLQVLGHLVANAREAMPGGGTLTVATERSTSSGEDGRHLPPGGYLHITFSDTGHGIPAANMPLLFEPYFSTKERSSQKGMGLGLALCDTLVHRHGGTLSVDSIEGQGATFHLYLPVAKR